MPTAPRDEDPDPQQVASAAEDDPVQSLLGAVPMAIMLVTHDGTIALANAASEQILGLAGAGLQGRNVDDLPIRAVRRDGAPVPPKDFPCRTSLATGVPQAATVIGVERPDRRVVWIEVDTRLVGGTRPDGRPEAVVCTFADVSDRLAADARLRDSERQLRLLAEHSSDVLLRQLPGGRVLYCSPAYLGLLGREPDELLGQTLVPLVHPDDVGRLRGARAGLDRGHDAVAADLRLRHRDGRWIWVELQARAIRGDAGELVELQIRLSAIGSRVRAEEELRRAAEEHAALRRVATAVAGDAEPDELHALVCREAAALLGADWASVTRLGHGPHGEVLATWPPDTAIPAPLTDEVLDAPGGASMPAGRRPADATHGGVVARVVLRGEVWGTLSAGASAPGLLGPGAEARLGHVADLVATAVANAEHRRALAEHAREQGALRRLATMAAMGTELERFFDAVAREVAELFLVERGLVARFESRGAVVVGAVGSEQPPLGSVFPLRGDGAIPQVARTGRPARVDDYDALPVADPTAMRTRQRGHRCGAAAPVRVGRRLWGSVMIAAATPGAITPAMEERLERFAEMVGVAIASVEDRAELAARAARDPLTGLANHRAFQDRLHDEVERAHRHGRRLSLVLFDLDRFAGANEGHGHQTGDRVLAEVARRIAGAARPGDLVARTGGDEFAWVLPEADSLDAWQAAERVRESVSETPIAEVGRVTLSGGVCDLSYAEAAADLYRLADGALYWAKAQGRDVCFRYAPDVVAALSAEERAERLEREQALTSVRLLARVVDAKDPSTRRHSERVADLAVRLAAALGWAAERSAALHEAGLVHDVGKVGVPDRILFKPGRLTPEEYAQVKEHAALGAQIVGEVLSAEQVAWVRGHHERPDGRGYPDGLEGDAVPEGARILAVADAWDVMTSTRAYSLPMPVDEALDECRRQSGTQFSPDVVDALLALGAGGELEASVGREPLGPALR